VFAFFALDGIGFGAWAAYLPTYKASLGLTDSQLGVALFALVIGSLVSMPATGRLLSRKNSRPVVLAGASAFSLTIPLVATAAVGFGSMGLFTTAALLFGATKGVIDVSANALALAVERRGEVPLLSTCHGGWSLGVLGGASATALALRLDLAPTVAATAIAAGLLALVYAAARRLPQGDAPAETPGGGHSIRPRGRLVPLAALAFLGLFCEGAMGDWATIFLADVVGASPSAAALGFAGYSSIMMCGRFAGDRLTGRLGSARLLAVSGASVALGLAFAIARRDYPSTVAGFGLVGFGVSNMVPILFRSAGRGADPGAAIASVSTVGYLGFLIGPPLIGALSGAVGLASALGVVVLFGLTIAASARFVDDRRQPLLPVSLAKSLDERRFHVQSEPNL